MEFFNNKKLSIEDLIYLSKLLNTNLSINECFDLLGNNKNIDIFNDIKKQLSQGLLINDVIIKYIPKQLKTYFDSLLKYLSFNQCLSLSLEFYDKQNNNQNTILNSIAYPCLLLFITITALYLFDLYGLDSLFNLMGSFSSNTEVISGIRIIFRIAINIIYYAVLLLVLLVIYFKQPKRIVLLYIVVSKYYKDSLFNLYYCEQFMSLLLICYKQGFKTKQSMEILNNMKSKPIISFLAFHLDDGLISGQSLNTAIQKDYYDSSLSRYLKLASYSNDFSSIINSYILITQEKIKNRMKLYTTTIQIVTYGFIGAVIIFIYQLLFMPMQAITNF